MMPSARAKSCEYRQEFTETPTRKRSRRMKLLPIADHRCNAHAPESDADAGRPQRAPESAWTNGSGPRASSRPARWPPRKSTRGRVSVNGQPAKPSRELRPGDRIMLRQGAVERTVELLALSRRARAGAGGAGAVRGDAGKPRRARRCRPPKPAPGRRTGGCHRAGPADQARPPPSWPTGSAGAPAPTTWIAMAETVPNPLLKTRTRAQYPLEVDCQSKP